MALAALILASVGDAPCAAAGPAAKAVASPKGGHEGLQHGCPPLHSNGSIPVLRLGALHIVGLGARSLQRRRMIAASWGMGRHRAHCKPCRAFVLPCARRRMDRLRALVHGTVLLLIVGWLLYVGKAIFVPAVLGAVIVYVIVGLAHALGRLPGVGRTLPLQLRYLFSMLVIGLAFFLLAYLVMANKERALAAGAAVPAVAAGGDPARGGVLRLRDRAHLGHAAPGADGADQSAAAVRLRCWRRWARSW